MKRTILRLGLLTSVCVAANGAHGDPIEFSNYGVLSMIDQPLPGQILWKGDYSDGPWNWMPHVSAPLPGWNANAVEDAAFQFTSELSIDEDLMATASFVITTTVVAREEENVVGTMVLSEVAGQGLLDLDASHALVDHETGMIFLRSGSPLDEGRAISEVTLADATGIFEGIEQVGPWQGFYSGYYIKPIWPETDLQQNIFEAPFIGGVFQTAMTGRYAMALPGDVNQDGMVDIADIDLLTAEVIKGEDNTAFDLNDDGLVDQQDRRYLVEDIGNTYFGDSNFDGAFNSADLIHVFQQHQYEDGITLNSTWSTGDWSGDGEFDSGDLILSFKSGGYERGARRTTPAVPEPSTGALLGLGLLVLLRLPRKLRRATNKRSNS